MQIADKTVVQVNYTLKNDSGEVLDSSEGQEPLAFLCGAQNIIPGLENALLGKQVGDKLDVRVEPSEGYGEVHEEMIQKVPKENFEGVDSVEVGMQFMAQAPWGEQPVTVIKVEEDGVTLDGNHPMAGQILNFSVEVVEVREASEEEVEHGHSHGAGGHHH